MGSMDWKNIRFRLYEDTPIIPEPKQEKPVRDRALWGCVAVGHKACGTCCTVYSESDGEAVTFHTEPVDCGASCPCNGKPRCRMCLKGMCFCSTH